MAASAFYGYLCGAVRSMPVRVVAILAILVTGVSRPYLGVHYVEDILLGWAIGLGLAAVALRYGDRIGAWWNAQHYGPRIGIAVAASLGLWAATIVLNGGRIDDQPRAFLGYAGAFTGIVIAVPLEQRFVNFDPRSSSFAQKIARYLLTIALAIVAMKVLGGVFAQLADDHSIGGYLLQYVRYVVVSVVTILVSPSLFTRLGLAQAHTSPANTDPASRPPLSALQQS